MRRLVVYGVLPVVFLLPLLAQSKKKKDDFTLDPPLKDKINVREVLQDPPDSVTAETRRLKFYVSPLTPKGVLSRQVEDSLKWLISAARREPILAVRAFVAGRGDVRRVQATVSEVFSEKKLSLPALSVVQTGGLTDGAAQVVLEAITQDRNEVNPHGLAFLSGQQVAGEEVTLTVAPLARQSLERLELALRAAGSPGEDMLRVSCFLSALDDVSEVHKEINSRFPRAVYTTMQILRALGPGLVECEGVARLRKAPAKPVEYLNPDGLPSSENYSQIALVNAPRLVLTGMQMSFGYEEKDVRLAFDRLGSTLTSQGSGYPHVFFTRTYPLTNEAISLVRKHRFEFLPKDNPPASTLILFQGLPALDASFALDVIAARP